MNESTNPKNTINPKIFVYRTAFICEPKYFFTIPFNIAPIVYAIPTNK